MARPGPLGYMNLPIYDCGCMRGLLGVETLQSLGITVIGPPGRVGGVGGRNRRRPVRRSRTFILRSSLLAQLPPQPIDVR